MQDSIPKIIHYAWFGNNEKGPLILSCIESWKKYCPEYEIREWNEHTFDINSHPFTKRMYGEKKWAFVADYVRLHALYTEGGIYLDTDMLLIKPLSPLLGTPLLLGKEDAVHISCGMIGSVPKHPFLKEVMSTYTESSTLRPNPVIFTELFKSKDWGNATVLEKNAFYPYTSHTIQLYKGQEQGESTYGIHLWNYSWGHPLNKFFKKMGVHYYGTKLAELLGIKKVLKKLLGFV